MAVLGGSLGVPNRGGTTYLEGSGGLFPWKFRIDLRQLLTE